MYAEYVCVVNFETTMSLIVNGHWTPYDVIVDTLKKLRAQYANATKTIAELERRLFFSSVTAYCIYV